MHLNNQRETAAVAASQSAQVVAALLAQGFPGMAADGRTAPSTAAAQALATEYLARHWPETRCAFLFGSYARGLQKPYSDLDMLVIVPDGKGYATEKQRLTYQGVAMELFITTERSVLDALAMSRPIGLRVFFDAVDQGIVLADTDGLAGRLSTLGRRELKRTDVVVENSAREQYRVNITQNLLKLSAMHDTMDQMQLGVLLYNAIAFAVLRVETGWAYRNERLPRELRHHDEAAAAALQSGLLALGAGQGADVFLAAAGPLLERLGGPLWHGSSEPMLAVRASQGVK